MTGFMITFTSIIIWIIFLLCKHIWSLHYIVFFVDFFRITVIKVWLLLVRGSTATGNDHLCDAWELFSRFSSTHVLIYLSTLSREVFDEKSVLTFTYEASSFLFEIFLAGLEREPRRNPKFLSEKSSFDIFFPIQTLLHRLSCSHLGFLKSLINPRYLCNFADLAISAVYVCINCTHRARKNGFTNQKSEYIILVLISFKCFGQNENCPSNV